MVSLLRQCTKQQQIIARCPAGLPCSAIARFISFSGVESCKSPGGPVLTCEWVGNVNMAIGDTGEIIVIVMLYLKIGNWSMALIVYVNMNIAFSIQIKIQEKK